MSIEDMASQFGVSMGPNEATMKNVRNSPQAKQAAESLQAAANEYGIVATWALMFEMMAGLTAKK